MHRCLFKSIIHVLCNMAWFYAPFMRKIFMKRICAGKRLVLMPFLGVYITYHDLEPVMRKIERETSLKILDSYLYVTILYVR